MLTMVVFLRRSWKGRGGCGRGKSISEKILFRSELSDQFCRRFYREKRGGGVPKGVVIQRRSCRLSGGGASINIRSVLSIHSIFAHRR